MQIRWKLAGTLVAINLALAITGLVGLAQGDPTWVDSAAQVAEKSDTQQIKLASVVPH